MGRNILGDSSSDRSFLARGRRSADQRFARQPDGGDSGCDQNGRRRELAVLPVILVHLIGHVGILNVFRYITFRAGGAVMTALLIAFVFGPAMIRWLRQRQGKGQPIRSDGPQRHIVEKQGTPTMGGLLILVPAVASTLLWADLSNAYV